MRMLGVSPYFSFRSPEESPKLAKKRQIFTPDILYCTIILGLNFRHYRYKLWVVCMRICVLHIVDAVMASITSIHLATKVGSLCRGRKF